jgi:hypothetical protein
MRGSPGAASGWAADGQFGISPCNDLKGNGLARVVTDGTSSALPLTFTELKLGYRQTARTPAIAFITVATLALGIGANIALLSIVNRIVYQPLPYADADRLVEPWADYKGDGTGEN